MISGLFLTGIMAMFRRKEELDLDQTLKGDGKVSSKLTSHIFLVLVLALFLTTLPTTALADSTGCYIYGNGDSDLVCNSNTLESQATADCENYDDCDISATFITGVSCDIYTECDEVL